MEVKVEAKSGKVIEKSMVIAPKKIVVQMNNWDDNITIYNPNGIDFINLSYEQLTIYASYISLTTICAKKDTITVKDTSNNAYTYIQYKGQPFHRRKDE